MDRPILFSAPMVRAILTGTKTQTRRVVKPQPEPNTIGGYRWNNFGWSGDRPGSKTQEWFAEECPYGQVGDRLWVRETWRATGLLAFRKPSETRACGRFAYRAEFEQMKRDNFIPWRPSIHMPRWASRITLEITGVRVERLQDISKEDAYKEGIREWIESFRGAIHYHPNSQLGAYPTTAFARLWDSINAKRASWSSNPWVWALTFKRVQP